MIDAHHHLWDLAAVHYPWLMAKGTPRFFGDPAPIQRDYLISEFRTDAAALGFRGSVHIQVGAENGLEEARWVQMVADAHPDWPMKQVAFCDLTADTVKDDLDALQALPSVVGIRQIVGRAPGEDAKSGTNALLQNPNFDAGLAMMAERGLGFDLQLIPELIPAAAAVIKKHPELKVALCHAGSPYNRNPEGLAQWQKQLVMLAEQDQVFCKLSGLGMFQHAWQKEDFKPIIETCLELFGAARCMFGSNFPVDSLTSDYQHLAQTHLECVPEEAHAQVFEKTAAEFYGFDG